MLISKCLVTFLVLCFLHGSSGKSTVEYVTEGRGIGSTLWGWITYPFTWWSSGEEAPVNDQLVAPTTLGPYDNIEIGKRNVTVWCNDQTCTTMKCDKVGCRNVTCNIYDTDLNGECREYNTVVKPEEPAPTKPTDFTKPTLQDKVTEPTKVSEVPSAIPGAIQENNQPIEEHPLELEAVLSSTVTDPADGKVTGDKDKSSSPVNKV